MQAKGIGSGDRVLVFIPMSISLYQTILGLFYLGATAVFLDAWADRHRLAQAIKQTECTGFIGTPRAHLLQLISPAIREIPCKLTSWQRQNIKPIKDDCSIVAHDVPALITFTTGSTGTPKAANRTYAFLHQQHIALADHLQLHKDDIVLTTLPIVILHSLAMGCTSIIADTDPRKPEKVNTEKTIKAINSEKVTTAIASPVFFQKLAKQNECPKATGLKRIFLGGAPVFPRLAQKLLNAFPGTSIQIIYGSTEAEPISTIDATALIDYEEKHNGLLVGKPVSGIKTMIMKPHEYSLSGQTEEVLANLRQAQGEPGEICVAGDFVLKNYYRSEDAWHMNKFRFAGDIWHRTGDAGYLDGGNNLFLLGRLKHTFVHKGRLFYVFPIENRLLEHPDVRLGTIIQVNEMAILVVEPQHRLIDKKKFLSFLEQLQLPCDKMVIMRKIPRDPRHNSKIDYDRLKSILSTN